jgi:hypothetical protein
MSEDSEEQLRASLGKLQDAEFFDLDYLFPDVEYTFRHSLKR